MYVGVLVTDCTNTKRAGGLIVSVSMSGSEGCER